MKQPSRSACEPVWTGVATRNPLPGVLCHSKLHNRSGCVGRSRVLADVFPQHAKFNQQPAFVHFLRHTALCARGAVRRRRRRSRLWTGRAAHSTSGQPDRDRCGRWQELTTLRMTMMQSQLEQRSWIDCTDLMHWKCAVIYVERPSRVAQATRAAATGSAKCACSVADASAGVLHPRSGWARGPVTVSSVLHSRGRPQRFEQVCCCTREMHNSGPSGQRVRKASAR